MQCLWSWPCAEALAVFFTRFPICQADVGRLYAPFPSQAKARTPCPAHVQHVVPTTYLPAAIDKAVAAIQFDAQGLVPAIAQQHDSGEILMMAWMDRDAVAETMRTGRVCYWSRSRKAPWRKGDTSGHIQTLVDLRIDCDGDTLLVLVDQKGVACHTGRHNCFFRAIRDGALETIAPVMIDMDATGDKLGKDQG